MTEDITAGMLALRPRNGFHFDAAARTIDASHGVGKFYGNVVDRDELEGSWLGHSVVSRTSPATTGAPGLAVGPWLHMSDDTHGAIPVEKIDGMVNEALDGMDDIEQTLNCDRRPPGWFFSHNNSAVRSPIHPVHFCPSIRRRESCPQQSASPTRKKTHSRYGLLWTTFL